MNVTTKSEKPKRKPEMEDVLDALLKALTPHSAGDGSTADLVYKVVEGAFNQALADYVGEEKGFLLMDQALQDLIAQATKAREVVKTIKEAR